ncbi:hypothetical protein GA0061070_10013 [Kosakonia oryziphila]|jgi:hypothetical protein|uniref:Uncharacterized protein n=1 Tax=Kosakonia oryziphila TaxID=1005667 RepID=A0A1C3YSD4_9ENTR|nr:hypothetical protein GA0061070_10013 [Kosakonia oryziphila]
MKEFCYNGKGEEKRNEIMRIGLFNCLKKFRLIIIAFNVVACSHACFEVAEFCHDAT